MVKQAVILAGGVGSRLRPLSLLRPKPMAEVGGRPFLEHLVDRLASEGFSDLLLCLGYLHEMIQDHFGDGSDFGISIRYDVQPVEFETGARIRAARHKLDETFFLLYSDNAWPFNRSRLEARFADFDGLAQITAYDNWDGYSRSNVRVQDGGAVEIYDKSRTAVGLSAVDIGFALIRKEALEYLPEGNVSFEGEVYKRLAESGLLGAFVTGHRYYGVGTFERLPSTELFLRPQRTVLLDRDGVLNARPPRAEYVCTWGEWRWIPGSAEAVARLSRAGYRVIVISNQPGIARGKVTEEAVQEIHRRMAAEVQSFGGRIESVYYCPHGWDDGCRCRKPAPGLLLQAQRDYCLDLSRCFFVGDDERDGMAAEAAGSRYSHLEGEYTLKHWVEAFLNSPS